MDVLQNLDILIVGAAIAGIAVLGFVIFFSNRNSITNKLFLAFSTVTVLWSLCHFAAYRFAVKEEGLWLLRFEIFWAVWLVFLQYVLIYCFPKDEVKFPGRFRLLVLIPLAVSLLNLTPLVFVKILSYSNDGHISQVQNGPGIAVFGLTVLSFVIAGIRTLIKKIKKAEDLKEKRQLRSVLYGIATMFSLLITFNFIFPALLNNATYVPLGALFILPFILFTGYAIYRHGLLNVKVISTEILTLVLSLGLLVQVINAENTINLLFSLSTFLLVLSVGVLLIRSVLKEVEQREQLQKLSSDLEKANQQLKQLDQAKSEFLSVASHQLRTPLTAIKGYASMFLAGDFGPVSDPQRQNLQVIFDSAQRLAVLVSDLLDLSRIESGRMEFDFKAVNLCETIESVITEVTPKAKDRKLYVYFDNVNRACPDVRADEEKLRQVVINLIDNAIKYTIHGGVTVRLMQADGQLQFSVTDTGIGVDPKEKDKLFEKFFRTQAANEVTREGTGLGIYVVKKIVEAHGGKIWFDSPGVNKGTTFYFTLPIPKGPIKGEKVKIDSLEAF